MENVEGDFQTIASFERDVLLRDGTMLRLRAAQPDDRAAGGGPRVQRQTAGSDRTVGRDRAVGGVGGDRALLPDKLARRLLRRGDQRSGLRLWARLELLARAARGQVARSASVGLRRAALAAG